MVFDEDIIDKKVIIIDEENTSNISIEIEPIKNVIGIKLVESYATISTNTDKLQTAYICINDYRLKTITKTIDNNTYTNDVFSSMIFYPDKKYNEQIGTGIISTFNIDTQNYVFNPVKGELRKLDISFKSLDGTNLIEKELVSVYLELCIYSKRMKQTMF
jgi:hypothetical protein